MKKKRTIARIIIYFFIVTLIILWLTGVIPKIVARVSGTMYVHKNFPEMQIECTRVEWASVFGEYIIFFKDIKGVEYNCIITPAIFPVKLGQGLFEIESVYKENILKLK